MDSYDNYDIIININSFKESIKEGIKIEASEEGMTNYNNHKKDYGIIILGIIGNLNVGKTYILSKITNYKLPSGLRTKGISVKYPINYGPGCMALDSAGSEAPLLVSDEFNLDFKNKSQDELIEYVSDKKITEMFLQNFILFSSNILIIVVGELTYSDQKLINRIKGEVWKQKIIFIIHNYMFLEKIEDVKDCIKNNVLTSITFGELIENHMITVKFDNTINNIYYTERYEKKNKRFQIIHLFMAKEGSEAGNYYNESTIEYLRKQLLLTNGNYYDIIERFKSYIALSSGEYMEKEIKDESIEYNENERKIIIKKDKTIKLKQRMFDEIEGVNFCKNIIDIIEPNFDCEIKENKIIITIELPGEVSAFKPRIIPNRGFYYFHFKATIKFPETEELCFKEGNMKDGEFRLDFKIPMNIGTIKNSPPEIKFDETNGIVIVTYEISKFAEKEDDSDIDI